jgi:hypothetical protein
MAQRTKRRRRRSGETPRRKGVMMGMRRGFKKAAGSVVGSEPKAPSRRRAWLSNGLSVLLILAAIAFLLYRWRR